MTLKRKNFAIASVTVFDRRSQQLLVRLYAQLRLFNELVEEQREHYRRTFETDIQGLARARVMENLRDTERKVTHRARYTADLIGEFEAITNTKRQRVMIQPSPTKPNPMR